jgi:hypothetical protein
MDTHKLSILDKANLLLLAIKNKNLPEVVYKYRTTTQAIEILNSLQFWFSTPNKFNDPFDTSLSECLHPSIEDAAIHLTRLNFSPAQIEKSLDLFRREPCYLYTLVETTKAKTCTSKGILSLSDKHDDILMWSHYANSHQGVVLGLHIPSDATFFLNPIRIDYRDKYDELNFLRDPEKSLGDTVRVKSSKWSYENELRILKESAGLFKINKQAIKDIYFGINTSQLDIKRIQEICHTNGLTQVKFWKGEKKHGEFEICFKSL